MLGEDEVVRVNALGLARLRARFPQMASRVGSFSDQGFQGVGNILANVFVARGLTHEQFASIGVMIGIHYFAWGLHRSNIVLPLIVSASDKTASRTEEDAWWWLNLISVILIAIALIAAALIFGMVDTSAKDHWLVNATAFAALVSPWLCMVEFARRRLYQHGRGVIAATASAAGALTLVVVAATVWRGVHSPWLAAGGWALGGVVGSVVATLAATPRFVPWSAMVEVWRRHRRFAFWQTMTAIPYAFYSTITIILVAAFSGEVAVAGFTVARTLTNPASAVVSAVDTLDKPRAARALSAQGLSGLRGSIRTTLLTVGGLTGPYLLGLAVFSSLVLNAFFGAAFRPYAAGVSILAVAAFFACLNQAPETALIVLKAGKAMFTVRIATAALVIVSLWAGAHWFGFIGCACALLVTNLANFFALKIVGDRILAGQVRHDG